MINQTLDDILDPYVPDEDKIIVRNLIKAAFLHHLPEPVDVYEKYETEEDGVWIGMTGDPRKDVHQLEFIQEFGQDCGYNAYRRDLRQALRLDNTVI